MSAAPRMAIAGGLVVVALGVTGATVAAGQEALPAKPPRGGALIWVDDFEGAAGAPPDPGVWTVQTGDGGWGNNELQTYTDAAVALDGAGHLEITATVGGTVDDPEFTSGRLSSHGLGSFTYGILEARIQLPEGQGLLPAFWLLGDDLHEAGWPAAGEIDIVETPNTTSVSEHHVHGPSTGERGIASVGSPLAHETPLAEDWHVFSLDKRPGLLVIRVDGREALRVTPETLPEGGEWVYDKPFHALFSLAIGGNWPGPPDETTPTTSVMRVDWVRLYGLSQLRPVKPPVGPVLD